MTGTYDVNPEGVTAIAEAIAVQGEQLAGYLEQSDFEGILDEASGIGSDGVFVNGFQALVQQAIGNLIEDQVPKLERISNTIKSSVTAVVLNATVYFEADDATRQGVLDQAATSALTGDMTFFENVIEQHNADQEAAATAAANAPAAAPAAGPAPAQPNRPESWQAPPASAAAAPPPAPPAGITNGPIQAQAMVVNEDGSQVTLGEFLASRTSGAGNIGIHVPLDEVNDEMRQMVGTAAGSPGPAVAWENRPSTWEPGSGTFNAVSDGQNIAFVSGAEVPSEPGLPTGTTDSGTADPFATESGTTDSGSASTGGTNEAPAHHEADPSAVGDNSGEKTYQAIAHQTIDGGTLQDAQDPGQQPEKSVTQGIAHKVTLPVEPVRTVGDRIPLTTAENDAIARNVGALLRGRIT